MVYNGICYESDQPEFSLHVPDGGLDCQEHPVYWTLPCGRTVSMSLAEFKDSLPDQLTPGCTDDAHKVCCFVS